MRRKFAAWLKATGSARGDLVFLTGDLGFDALEGAADALKTRFINVGVSEQNMVSLAAGLAQQGLTTFCYSISSFAVFRPAEQIRIDVCLHNLNVKIVGNGGGYGYGIMGATHHAIEDLALLSSFQNMVCFVPFCNEDVFSVCDVMMNRRGPSYLRLGYGPAPASIPHDIPYSPVRKIMHGRKCTVVGIGPVILNVIQAMEALDFSVDVFVISELPLVELSSELLESLKRTGRLLVVEEHVRRGGLGEFLAAEILHLGISVRFVHRHAVGYPDGLYGSQRYHQMRSGLDSASLQGVIREMSQ